MRRGSDSPAAGVWKGWAAGRRSLLKGGLTVSAMDKMKNKGQEVSGQGKEHVGKATDDESMEAEGNKDQASGNIKQAGEKVKDVFK
jgi:uncharacterized protein YjbJ (UPF0337 family)